MNKDVLQLLYYLQEANASIRVDDSGNLKIDAAKGVITPEIANSIKQHKEAIVLYVRSHGQQEEIVPVTQPGPFRLSNGQKRLWVLSQDEQTSITYNLAGAYKLTGVIDPEILGKSWQLVVGKHEVLRTVFVFHNGELLQEITDLSQDHVLQFPASETAWNTESIQDFVLQDANQAFDLEKGPLVKACCFLSDNNELVFYYKIHHLIADGWSMHVLWNELIHAYGQLLNGIQPKDQLSIQYKDFAHWQSDALDSGKMQAHKAFWHSMLSEDVPALKLPYKINPDHNGTGSSKTYSSLLPVSLTEGLQQYASEQNSTVYTTLFTALNVLLYRYTDQQDITLGIPVSGRDKFDLDNQIGLYINTLAIRNSISGESGYRELFEVVNKNTLDAHVHQSYPFDQLIADIRPDYTGQTAPLFNVFVDYQHEFGSTDTSGISGISIQPFGTISELAKFDLTVNFIHQHDGIVLRLIYKDELFDAEMMDQFSRHFVKLTGLLLDHPTTPISKLQFLDAEEINLLTQTFNKTDFTHDLSMSCMDRFHAHVTLNPNKTALIFNDHSISYRELDEQSNRVAHYLVDNGIKANDCVAIAMTPSINRMVAIFGIVKSGAAYLPLGIDYPLKRIEQIAESSGYQFLLTEEANDHLLELDKVLTLESVYASEQRINATHHVISPDDLAYIIYTSGSTGNPKGVMIDHKALVNRIEWMQHAYPITEEDAILHKTVYTFDVSVWELFWFSTVGATLVILPGGDEKLPDRMIEQIQKHAVSVLHFVPAMLNGFLTYCEAVDSEKALRSLRYVFASGEELKGTYANRFYEFFTSGNTHLINLYGPTEATIDVTYFDCLPEVSYTSVPIGKPVHNTQLFVLDKHLNLMPKGCMGELYLGGIQISKGYLNDPERTAAAFIPSPFDSGKILYKTGDLTCWNEHGEMEYHGRVDHQVKVRGFRIELGDIENALERLPAVSGAAVLVITNHGVNVGLVAYVTTHHTIRENEIIALLKKELPEYMLPSKVIFLDKMPLSDNGKVHRKSLPAYHPNERNDVQAHQPVETENERLIAQVWKDVLKITTLGKQSNFYQLGGDSIKSILIASKLRQAGYFIKIPDILAYPVLSEQATKLESGVKAIDQGTITGHLELSAIQHDFLSGKHEEKQHYNQSVLLKVTGSIDVDRITKAVDALLLHHDGLRAFFYSDESGNWTQEIADPKTINAHVVSVELQEGERLKDLLSRHQSSFSLNAAPLIKAVIVHAKEDQYLALISHHLIIDGVSWRILLEDLTSAYEQATNKTITLPLKTDSLKSWQEQLKDFKQSDAFQQEISYWAQQVVKEDSRLPIDFAEGSNIESDSRVIGFSFSQKETQELLEKIPLIGVEINAFLLSTLYGAIENVFKLSSLQVTLEGHGREPIGQSDTTRTIGWFTSMYPLLLSIEDPEPIIRLKKINRQLKSIPSNGLGFGLLQQDQLIASNGSSEILFNYLGDIGNDLNSENNGLFELSGLSRGQEISPLMPRNTELEFSVMMIGGSLQFSIVYSDKRWKEESITTLANTYHQQLTVYSDALTATETNELSYVDTYKLVEKETFNHFAAIYPLENIYPMTGLQQGIFYHWLLNKTALTYVCQSSYRVKGKLLPELMKEAFHICLQRHETLRSNFHAETGDFLQIIRKQPLDSFTFISQDENKGHDTDSIKTREREKGFDLQKDSLIRLTVVEIEPNVFDVHWTYHHIIMDGWSLGLLVNEFNAIYNDLFAKRDSSLYAIPSYQNYLNWSNRFGKQSAMEFWGGYLNNAPQHTGIPLNQLTSYSEGYSNAHLHTSLGEEWSETLIAFCQNEGITTNAFFQFIWGIILSDYHKQNDVVYGVIHSGRPEEIAGIEHLIGLFIDLNPMRLQLSGEHTIRQAIKEVHELLIRVQPHQLLDYNTKLKASGISGSAVDHILLFQNYHMEDLKVQSGDANFEIVDIDSVEQTNYNLVVSVFQSNQVNINFEFNGLAYHVDDVRNLAEQMTQYIIAALSSPQKTLGQLNWVPTSDTPLPPAQFNDNPENKIQKTVAPKSETEIAIYEIWKEVLIREDFGVQDDFFTVGGDSILTIKTAVLINKQLGSELVIADLYTHRTISSLAAFITTTESKDATDSKNQSAIIREEIAQQSVEWLARADHSETYSDIYPMSEVEKGMMYDSMIGSTGTFHIQSVFHLQLTDFDKTAFTKAVNQLIEKHDILRTEYILDSVQGGLHAIRKSLAFDPQYTHLSSLTDRNEQETYLNNYLKEERERPFGWGQSPMWKISIFDLGSDHFTFIWQVHHALMDGWSSQVFFEELVNTYSSIITNQEAPVAVPNVVYKDAVIEQLVTERNPDTSVFWRNYLAGFEHPDLFSSSPSELFEKHVVLTFEESERLKEFTAKSGKTLKATVFAAYFSALSKVQYQGDKMIGLVTNTRPQRIDSDRLIGCFLNTIPIRLNTNQETTNYDLIDAIEREITVTKAFDKYPTGKIWKESGLASGEHSAIDLLFNYNDFTRISGEAETADAPVSGFSRTNSLLDLSVENGKRITFSFAFNRQLRCTGGNESFIQSYFEALEALIFPEEMKSETITDSNDKVSDESFSQAFARVVDANADKTALVTTQFCLSYGQLDEWTNTFAHNLIANGVNQGAVVAVENVSREWNVISFLALIKIGAVYLPVDPKLPEARKNHIYSDSGASYMITDQHHPKSELRILTTDQLRQTTDAIPTSNGYIGSADQNAYLIYTSGTTGKPKGVMLSARGLVNLSQLFTNEFTILPNDRILQFASQSFDASLWEFTMALLTGASLHIPEETVLQDPKLFSEFLVGQELTVMTLPPVFLQNIQPQEHQKIRLLITAGSAPQASVIRNWINHTTYINAYGPTETSICSNFYRIPKDGIVPDSIPIGQAIPNYQVSVLNEQMNHLLQGAVGEVVISGPGLAKGYLNLPELTEACFTTATALNNATVYRTGDFGRINEDGQLEFVGRKDDQVKIRGFRIELREIESAALAISEIAHAGAFVHEQQLYMIYVSDQLTPDALKQHLTEQLPSYMIPQFIFKVGEIPVSISGKLNTNQALLMIGEIRKMSSEFIRQAETEIEQKIAEIWKTLLNTSEVDVATNFFDAGGDSIKLMQLHQQLQQLLGIQFPLVLLFQHSSIQAMAALYHQQTTETTDRSEALSKGRDNRNKRRELRTKTES